jgi:hypothetical protein
MNVVQEFLPGREGNDFKPKECQWEKEWVWDECRGNKHLVVSAGRGLVFVQKATRAPSGALTSSTEGKKLKWNITQAGLNFLSFWKYPNNPREEEVLAAIAARTLRKKSKKRRESEEIDEDGRLKKKHKKVDVLKTTTARVPVLREAVAATHGTLMSNLLDISKKELLERFVHITFLHFCARHKHNSYIIYNVDVGWRGTRG